jgi:hypothetical protein
MGLRTSLRAWLGLEGKSAHKRRALRIYADKIGEQAVVEANGTRQLSFDAGSGFDYDAYRKIQTIANHGKLHMVSVQHENIAHLVKALTQEGLVPRSILCHGTRNAAEQKMFKAELPDAEILGTEISDTATQFSMTIQWDFHETKPEWLGAFDLVFSNSWDHSYDADKLFKAWLSCVAPGGALALEWNEAYGWKPSVVDPFRASLKGLMTKLIVHGTPLGFSLPHTITGLPVAKRGRLFVVMRRLTAQ